MHIQEILLKSYKSASDEGFRLGFPSHDTLAKHIV